MAPGPRNTERAWYGSRLYEIRGRPAPLSPGYHVLLNPSRLRRILERERPDVIELGSIYLAPWVLRVAARGMRIPTVGFFHLDLAGAVLRTLARRWPRAARGAMRGMISAYLRSAYAGCNLVLGASEASLQAMAGAGIAKGRLAPFGVDLETFHPDRRDPAWKAEVGVPGRPVALFVGRLTREKNLPVMLGALPRLHARFGLTLVLIGNGGWRPALQAMAAQHPERLVVLPFEPEPVRLARAYASADVYVATSPHETFGLSAMEAAACGLPVVGAAGGALDERLTGAAWARLVPAGEPAAWADAAGSLLEAGHGVRAAARQAATGFGWDRTFDTLVEIYRAAITEGAHGARAGARKRRQ